MEKTGGDGEARLFNDGRTEDVAGNKCVPFLPVNEKEGRRRGMLSGDTTLNCLRVCWCVAACVCVRTGGKIKKKKKTLLCVITVEGRSGGRQSEAPVVRREIERKASNHQEVEEEERKTHLVLPYCCLSNWTSGTLI